MYSFYEVVTHNEGKSMFAILCKFRLIIFLWQASQWTVFIISYFLQDFELYAYSFLCKAMLLLLCCET